MRITERDVKNDAWIPFRDDIMRNMDSENVERVALPPTLPLENYLQITRRMQRAVCYAYNNF